MLIRFYCLFDDSSVVELLLLAFNFVCMFVPVCVCAELPWSRKVFNFVCMFVPVCVCTEVGTEGF